MKLINILTVLFISLTVSSCADYGLVGQGPKPQPQSPFVISRVSTSSSNKDVVWKKKTKHKTVNSKGTHN